MPSKAVRMPSRSYLVHTGFTSQRPTENASRGKRERSSQLGPPARRGAEPELSDRHRWNNRDRQASSECEEMAARMASISFLASSS